jgi:pyruvate formate lyase activating enzyme
VRIGGLQACSLIDYPGHISAIVFTIGCNFRCPFCHNPELVDETAVDIDSSEIFSLLSKRQGKLDAVTITGGEPTLHSDLPEFVRKIKDMGYLVKLDSNGTNPDMLKSLVTEKLVDYVAMDIKAPLETYCNTTARPVDTSKIKESIAFLLSDQVPYEFRTTVVKCLLSPADFHAIGQQIAGARQYYLQKFMVSHLLNPQFRKKTTYSDEEFASLAQIMEQYVTSCQIR